MTPIDCSRRAQALRSLLAGHAGAPEGLLVTDLTNIRWLTGFTGSSGWVVVLPDDLVLITDGRYGAQAERQLATSGTTATIAVGTSAAEMQRLLMEAVHEVAHLGFESAHLTHQQFVRFGEALAPALVPTVGLVERGRRRKDAAEVERIEAACVIADAALAQVAPRLGDGLTEIEVRNALEAAMRDFGAAGPSYETIVAAGPVNAPMPHHRPTPTRI